MGAFIREWWEVGAGIVTVLSMIIATLYKQHRERRREIARLKGRLSEIEHAHEKHEDICGQRWKALQDSNQKLEKRIDERHVQSVAMMDQRHTENVARFNRFETMLVELLTRHNMRQAPREGD